MKNPNLAHAHMAGACDVAFDPTGRLVATCGGDGAVNVYEVSTGANGARRMVASAHHGDEPCNALAWDPSARGSLLATGGDDRRTALVSVSDITAAAATAAGDAKKKGADEEATSLARLSADTTSVSRCALPVRTLAFSPTGGTLAVGCDDGDVKLVDLADPTQCCVLRGHAGAVRCAAYDPLGEFVATSGCDGDVRVWSVRGECVAVLSSVIPATAAGDVGNMVRVDWDPTGSHVAVAGTSSVLFIERGSWSSSVRRPLKVRSEIGVVKFSPNGRYLATAGVDRDKSVMVWDLETVESVAKFPAREVVTAVSWHPTGNALAVIDAAGEFGVWDGPIAKHFVQPAEPCAAASAAAATAAAASSEQVDPASLFDNDDDDDDNDDDGNDAGGSDGGDGNNDGNNNGHDAGAAATTANGDGDNGDDDDDDDGAPMQAPRRRGRLVRKSRTLATDDDGPGGDIGAAGDVDLMSESDDGGAGDIFAHVPAKKSSNRGSRRGAAAVTREIVEVAPRGQAPFQPGASPMVAAVPGAASRRFLAWTMIGVITTRDEMTHSSVEIEFFDTTRHKHVRFTDHYNFTMASLSATGALFACRSDAKTMSTLFFKPFATWTAHAEWTLHLPAGEDVVAVSAGRSFLAAATTAGHLRILTTFGVQRFILSLASPVVAIAAAADRDAFAVVTQGTPGGGSGLAVTVYEFDDAPAAAAHSPANLPGAHPRVSLSAPVPLTPKATLAWVGFSDDGALCTADSAQVVRRCVESWGSTWLPVAELGREKVCPQGGKLWVTGVTADEVMTVPCKATEAAPPVLPRPVPAIVNQKVPMIEHPGIELEESLVRVGVKLDRARSAPVVDKTVVKGFRSKSEKTLVQLFHAACKADKGERALEIAGIMETSSAMNAAKKLAFSCHLPALADKIQAQWDRRQAAKLQAKAATAAAAALLASPAAMSAHQQIALATPAAAGLSSSSLPSSQMSAAAAASAAHAPGSARSRLAMTAPRTVTIIDPAAKSTAAAATAEDVPAPPTAAATTEDDAALVSTIDPDAETEPAPSTPPRPAKSLAAPVNPFAKRSPSKANPSGGLLGVIEKVKVKTAAISPARSSAVRKPSLKRVSAGSIGGRPSKHQRS